MTERRFPQLPSRSTRIVVYLVLIAVLLGINYWGAHRVIQETRIRVPYSPFFLEQVRAGNVVSITSTVSEVQGTFARAMKPAGQYRSPAIERFDDLEELLVLDPIHEVDEAGWPVTPADK